MDPQILVVLFLIFSALTSLYKKLKGQQKPDESKLQRRHPSSEVGNDPFEEKKIDLSEWESLFEPPKPVPKPEPEPPPREFQEVQGKRPVSEADTGPEFEAIRGKRPVSDESSYVEGKTQFTRASKTRKLRRSKHKRRRLKFDHHTIREAIIYNEILGPPRADKMPF